MSSRLDDIPVYELIETTVPGADYNLVSLALKRLGRTIHIPLAGLRKLELIIDPEGWIVIDNDLNEVPVLAWTDFQTTGRSALHEPVQCKLKTYHMHAQVILKQVTEFMEKELAARISEQQKTCEFENITPLRKE